MSPGKSKIPCCQTVHTCLNYSPVHVACWITIPQSAGPGTRNSKLPIVDKTGLIGSRISTWGFVRFRLCIQNSDGVSE